MEFDDGHYEQEDVELEPTRRRKRARRRAIQLIDAEAGVNRDAYDEGTDEENNDLDGFTVADDIEF